MSPDIVLKIGGQRFDGWTSMSATRSIEQLAGTFELGITERWAGQLARRPIRAGAACELSINAELVISGYIDDADPSYDKSNHTITIRGRSKTADLVDCSAVHEPGEFKDQVLAAIAAILCKPFGIDVLPKVEFGAPFKTWKVHPGETVFECLERAARHRAMLLTSDAEGNLIITRAGKGILRTALTLGDNIEAASGTFSHRNRFSEYTVKGDHKGSDTTSADDATGRKGEASDPNVKRYRPLIILAEDQIDNAAALERAEWEASVRAGRARQVTYTVSGWDSGDGLWQPNRLIPVNDDYQEIHQNMLISTVTYVLDESGSKTDITVNYPEAFAKIAVPEDTAQAGWG